MEPTPELMAGTVIDMNLTMPARGGVARRSDPTVRAGDVLISLQTDVAQTIS